MSTKTAKRVTYVKVDEGHDYVDARFDVFLDGKKVAQVTRNVEAVGRTSRSLRYFTSVSDVTIWSVEATDYREYVEYRSRVDAVMAFLETHLGMGWQEAREATGKRGI